MGAAAALVAFAPAQWLAQSVTSQTQGRVLLDDVRGTIWNGSARVALAGGQGSSDAVALTTPLDWRLRLGWNGLTADLSTLCCTNQFTTLRVQPRWGGGRLKFDDSVSQWPAGLLAGLGTPWNTLQLDGNLALSTQGLSVEWVNGRVSVAGRAELMAQRMSSRLSTLRPMGSYRITLSGGDTPSVQLETLEGSLNLSGSGQWAGSRLHFSGVASAAPEREDALANLLNIIGRRNGPRSIITIG